MLATSDPIEKERTLERDLSIFLRLELRLLIAVHSRDRVTSISTLQNSIDKYISADVNVVCYEYETQTQRILYGYHE